MIGLVEKGNPFHLLWWASHRSRRPAKYTPDAELLASIEVVDDIVMLRRVLTEFFGVHVKSMMIVDSKELYHGHSLKKNMIDTSVLPDVNAMRLYFVTTVDVFSWITRSLNPSDVGTKF